jgi:hypothetical protein
VVSTDLGREVVHEQPTSTALVECSRRLAEKRIHAELEVKLCSGDLSQVLDHRVARVPVSRQGVQPNEWRVCDLSAIHGTKREHERMNSMCTLEHEYVRS